MCIKKLFLFFFSPGDGNKRELERERERRYTLKCISPSMLHGSSFRYLMFWLDKLCSFFFFLFSFLLGLTLCISKSGLPVCSSWWIQIGSGPLVKVSTTAGCTQEFEYLFRRCDNRSRRTKSPVSRT